MSSTSNTEPGSHMNCAHCGARLKLSELISPIGSIRCGQCKRSSQRLFSARRITAVFALAWALIGALYLGRSQVGEWALLLPLLVIYAAVNAAIIASAPLRIEGTDSRSSKQWRAAVFLGLLLLTMLGIKWLRSA